MPTYDLKVKVPNASKLVVGNDVRAGGFRIGAVDQINSGRATVDGEETSVAILSLKLDKAVQPLAEDTLVAIRSRSALGLKYVELSPGTRSRASGGRNHPLRNARLKAGEIEDFTAIFDNDTRAGARAALEGFGSALAAGDSITGRSRRSPAAAQLLPVMRNSPIRAPSSPVLPAARRALRELAPVAGVRVTSSPTRRPRCGDRPNPERCARRSKRVRRRWPLTTRCECKPRSWPASPTCHGAGTAAASFGSPCADQRGAAGGYAVLLRVPS